jgi:hypothetical protein
MFEAQVVAVMHEDDPSEYDYEYEYEYESRHDHVYSRAC